MHKLFQVVLYQYQKIILEPQANKAHLQATLVTPRSKLGAMRTPIKPIPFTFTCTCMVDGSVEVVNVCFTAIRCCSSGLLAVWSVDAVETGWRGMEDEKEGDDDSRRILDVERGCDWQLQKVERVGWWWWKRCAPQVLVENEGYHYELAVTAA